MASLLCENSHSTNILPQIWLKVQILFPPPPLPIIYTLSSNQALIQFLPFEIMSILENLIVFALMVDTTPLKNPTKDQICRGEYVTLFLSYVRSIRLRLGRQKKSRSAVECSIFAVVGYDSSWHYFP